MFGFQRQRLFAQNDLPRLIGGFGNFIMQIIGRQNHRGVRLVIFNDIFPRLSPSVRDIANINNLAAGLIDRLQMFAENKSGADNRKIHRSLLFIFEPRHTEVKNVLVAARFYRVSRVRHQRRVLRQLVIIDF